MFRVFSGFRFNCKIWVALILVLSFGVNVQFVQAELELEFVKSGPTEAIDNAGASFKQIGILRKQNPIDIDAIESLYINDIQVLVNEVDTANKLTLDSDIVQAINDIRNNNETSFAVQTLDKTLQRVFLITAFNRANSVKSNFNIEETNELNRLWDEGFAAFNVISGTINQLNRILSDDGALIVDSVNSGLAVNVLKAFINGQDAINKDADDEDDGIQDGDLTRIKVQRQIIRFTMERAFYLVVLKEVKGALEKMGSEPDGALVNLKEGEVYHRAIAEKVSKDNEPGNKIIEAQLTGGLADISANTIIKEYSKAWLNGTIRELDGNSGAMADGDTQKAIETGHEGRLFAEMMIDDLGQRLGKTDRDIVTKSFGDLILASAKGIENDASTLRETISDILEEYAAILGD